MKNELIPHNSQSSRHHHHSPTEVVKAFSAATGDKVDLFVYGTLMNKKYVKMLLNRDVQTVPAVIYHYMRITAKWSFPFIVRQYGAKTEGLILKDLTWDEIKLLDKFEDEGKLYHRIRVIVRVGDMRQRCMMYIGNISAIQKHYAKTVQFEDRFSMYIESKIDEIIDNMPTDRPDITRRVLHELMSSAVDNIIQSHFDGNYICNYIMIQALEEARPPSLKDVLKNEKLLPYAGNYIRLACQHIVFNQFVELIRRDYPDAVRLSQQYFRQGLGVLLGLLYYNSKRKEISQLFEINRLDRVVEGRSYRDYARVAIEIVDNIYRSEDIVEIIDRVESSWYSTPTPLGAELEFSYLGTRAVYAKPGEDPVYDSFYWFNDFDMVRRTWRFGGHVDSHRNITVGQKRHRGFFEYALGRYQIVGDLSRPLFDCPWAMSLIINECVKFLDIPPHSLHISFELSGTHSHITNEPHKEEDLVCLLLLGGDLRKDETGKLREWRIYNNELDTNFRQSLNFCDRKYHFATPEHDESHSSEVMEYKFMRLWQEKTDYETLIVALKGYQFASHARPITIPGFKQSELPEHKFLREWGKNPQPIDKYAIYSFLAKIEQGLIEEMHGCKIDKHCRKLLEKIEKVLCRRNEFLQTNCPDENNFTQTRLNDVIISRNI